MTSSCTVDQFRCYDYTSNSTYCLAASDFDCSMWSYCDCPFIKSDSDIAGKGVLYSFLVSAAATIVLTTACLVLKRDYNDDQLNQFDRKFRRWVCRPLRKRFDNKEMDRWADRLYAVVLSLSDSQLVTGIAMLASAIKLMNDGQIIVYHFNIVSDLAWFSSNTHLLAMLIIRTYMSSNKNRLNSQPQTNSQILDRRFTNEDALRYVRLALMVILAILLVYVSYLSGAYNLYDNINCPMRCITPFKKGGEPLRWTIVNTFFVLWSYPPAIISNVPIASRTWLGLRERIRKQHEIILHRLHGARQNNMVLNGMYRTMAYSVIWAWSLFASEIEGVLEITGWFIFGVISVVRDRDLGKTCKYADDTPCMSLDEWNKQNEFTFGQLVPLFLLALPVLTFIEAWGEKESIGEERS